MIKWNLFFPYSSYFSLHFLLFSYTLRLWLNWDWIIFAFSRENWIFILSSYAYSFSSWSLIIKIRNLFVLFFHFPIALEERIFRIEINEKAHLIRMPVVAFCLVSCEYMYAGTNEMLNLFPLKCLFFSIRHNCFIK